MDSVIYYSLYFIISTLSINYLIFFLNKITKYKVILTKYTLPMILVLVEINVVSDILNIIIIKNFTIILSFILFIKYTSKLSLKESIVSFLHMFIMLIIAEIISGFLFTHLIHVKLDNHYVFLSIKTFGMINTIIIFYIYYIIKKIKSVKRMQFNVSWLLLISILFLLITIAALNFISTYNKLYSTYYLFLVLLIFIVLGIYNIVKLLRNDYSKKEEINNLKSKNDEVIKYINEFKTYKHNLKYNLIAIKECGNSEVVKQIDELLDHNKNELEYINNFKEVPSNLIHVFSDCLTLNNDNNITVVIKNSFKDKELNIDMNNYLKLNEVLGICLTNAIEAIPDEDGFIYVYFYEEEQSQCIDIINNFENNIDVDLIGKVNYSTKNRDSGFGLCSIFKKHHSIDVTCSIVNNTFKIKIKVIKNK